jgi:hypothetical protein
MKKFITLYLIFCIIISSTILSLGNAAAEQSPRAGQPPVITTTNVLNATVGKYYSVNYTATDPDTNQSGLSWSWLTNSTWLTFTTSQELKGTPTKIGVCWVNITVTDGSNYDHAVFYIVVSAASSNSSNQPPVINTTNILTAYVGKYYTVNYTATDPDTNQSSLVWSWKTNSTWLNFTTTQELKGTPTKPGVCWVNITVTDGNSYDHAVFYITVKSTPSNSSNQPPVINTTNILTAYVGKYYSVNYTATDPDTSQQNLTWGWKTNSTWLNFTSTQELKGTPTKAGVCWVNISVTDGTSYDYAVFYIVVKKSSPPPSNQPPVITTTNVITTYVGKYYSVNYTATDPDTNQSSLVWGWKTNSTWLNFTTNQELQGTPTKSGVCWVNISVTDGTSYDYAVFYLTIKKLTSPSNQPPKITTTNIISAFVGKFYSVNYTATDPDTNQSSLVWGWRTNSTWLNFTATQQLKGTPITTGVCWVNISVTDGNSYDYAVFYIVVKKSTVLPKNQPPKITTKNALTATVGLKYSVQYSATDPDTNSSNLTWVFKTNSTWLKFSSTQLLYGTPIKPGVCWVNLSVTDGTNSDYAVFYIVVKKGNNSYAPSILYDSISSDHTDDPIDPELVTITFSDPMDTTSVESALSISPEISHTILWNADKTVMTIIFDEEMSSNTKYTISVDRTSKDINGNTLETKYDLDFTTKSSSSDTDDIGGDDSSMDKEDQNDQIFMQTIGIFVITIIIFILLTYLFLIKKRKKLEPSLSDGRVPSEVQYGAVGDSQSQYQDHDELNQVPSQPSSTTNELDEILESVTLEAFGPVKIANTSLGDEAKIEELKLRLNRGEISQNTYDEAMNILSGKIM